MRGRPLWFGLALVVTALVAFAFLSPKNSREAGLQLPSSWLAPATPVPAPAMVQLLPPGVGSPQPSPGFLPWGLTQINAQTANVVRGEQSMVQALTEALKERLEQLLSGIEKR